VAAVPLAAGITGASYLDPVQFSDGFRVAMIITAGLSLAGAVVAALRIRNPERVPEAVAEAVPTVPARWFCGAEGTPLQTCPGSSAGDDGPRRSDDRAA
jgi:hypothetical protein